jgi:hypothetical protein
MKHIWSILCERIIEDKRTNLISYLTAIELVQVKQVPFRIPFLAMGSLWVSNDEQGGLIETRLKRIDPDKSEKVLIPRIRAEFTTKRYRSHMLLNGLEFDQSGLYLFRLESLNESKWEIVAEIPLDLTVVLPTGEKNDTEGK